MSLFVGQLHQGQIIGNGTGFIVRNAGEKPLLITNRHVVTGRRADGGLLRSDGLIPDALVVYQNVQGHLGQWVAKVETLYKDGQPLWSEHIQLREKVDVVALPLASLDGVEIYAYDLSKPGPAITVGPADSVSVIGFPFGLRAGGVLPIWATGFMASEPDINFDELPVFLIDCRGRPGQSGSPVIAYRSSGAVGMSNGSTSFFGGAAWRLLGIYSGRINDQSDLGIVWKLQAIQDVVAASAKQ